MAAQNDVSLAPIERWIDEGIGRSMEYKVSYYHVEKDSVTPLGAAVIQEAELADYMRNASQFIEAFGQSIESDLKPNHMMITDDLEKEVFRAPLDEAPTP